MYLYTYKQREYEIKIKMQIFLIRIYNKHQLLITINIIV